MSTSRRAAATAIALLALALSACAAIPAAAPAAAPPPRLGDVHPAPPKGDVLMQGMVMDKAGTEIQLCHGEMLLSNPPQCRGVPLDGWNWDAVEGEETAADSTFGSYAVTGTYDGEQLTVTADPVLLALFDPMVPEDPTGGVAGTTPDGRLERIAATIRQRMGDAASPRVEDGYVRLEVVWDDGTYQDAADAEFGARVVIVERLMRPVEPVPASSLTAGRLGAERPAPPSGEVTATGILQGKGARVTLCLDAWPDPRPARPCDPIPVTGLDDAGIADPVLTCVSGDYDGSRFHVTSHIPEALCDRAAERPQRSDDLPAGAGPLSEADAAAVLAEIGERLGHELRVSTAANGRVLVTVVWDDGTYQRAADAEFGIGAVVVDSAIWAPDAP
ncbi:hypothetical protein [Microbacterium rhizophilus]|uniref:hypothetical protein n=1 Tax=Microbacterium rhizophilus TaxID=3138934 RepID=UPI0031E51C56